MEPIQVSITKQDLKTQLNFLIQKEFKITYYRYRKLPYYLLGLTIVIIIISFLPDSDNLIIFKGVSITIIALAWVASLIFLSIILIKRLRRNKWRDDSIKHFQANPKKFSISFNEKNITTITEEAKSETNWSYFKYYTEEGNSIYIFSEKNVYEALYYSRNGLGNDNYNRLKSILQSTLTDLKSVNGA